MLKDSDVSKIANQLDRDYLRRVIHQLNELGETKLVNENFSDQYIEANLGVSFVNQINSIPEDVFVKLCNNNQFPKEVEKLYMVLTKQNKPEPYMISKIKFVKKPKVTNQITRVGIDDSLTPKKEARRRVVEATSPPVIPKKGRRRPETKDESILAEEGKNAFNMKKGTIGYEIAALIMENKHTIQEIARMVGKHDSYVHQTINRMKKHDNYVVFDERNAGRKIIGCDKMLA